MEITRNRQTVTFEMNAGILTQVTPYLSMAGERGRAANDYLMDGVHVRSQDRALARQAVRAWAAEQAAVEGPRSECCGELMSPENRCENCGARGAAELQTWEDVDVVARTEQLHPATHPYRANEVVEYVGPSGIGSWVHGPLHFRRMVEVDMAEIMTMSGPKYVEVADLRRPSGNVAVELTPEDIRQIFQALATEADRLGAIKPQLWPDTVALTVELRDRFAALHR